MKLSFMNKDVLELPRILKVEVIVQQLIPAILQRVPVSVVASNGTNILILDLQASLVVHLIRLHQTGLGVLKGPSHASNYS